MKLGIMQPYFFPYLGYYQAISAVDKYMLYDNVAYIKDRWMNKNRILVVDREPAYFIAPVKNKSSYKKIGEIQLDNKQPWRRQMLKSIVVNYKRAPFYDEVYALVEHVVNAEVGLLAELNARSILEIARYLQLKTEIATDSSRYAHLEEELAREDSDLASRFPSITLPTLDRKAVRIIEICRAEGADAYVNAIGGRELYDKAEFARHGIMLSFIRTNDHSYRQLSGVFHPNLSIIDVLMNCGRDGTKQLLNQYSLV